MFERTETFLAQHPDIWDDSGFAFGHGRNRIGTHGLEAVIDFFPQGFVAPSRAGCWNNEINLHVDALREIDLETAHRALRQLLCNDLAMFSVRQVAPELLDELVRIFFAEAGASRVYCNTCVQPADQSGDCLCAWTPVTGSTRDTFICVVNGDAIGYWLYADDE
jgi:hypothetical protein